MALDLRFNLIQKDVSTKEDSDQEASAIFRMDVVFAGKQMQISKLKLSHYRPLLGKGSAEYTALLTEASKADLGDAAPHEVRVTRITNSRFIAWAKHFGDSQALQIINAIP